MSRDRGDDLWDIWWFIGAFLFQQGTKRSIKSVSGASVWISRRHSGDTGHRRHSEEDDLMTIIIVVDMIFSLFKSKNKHSSFYFSILTIMLILNLAYWFVLSYFIVRCMFHCNFAWKALNKWDKVNYSGMTELVSVCRGCKKGWEVGYMG